MERVLAIAANGLPLYAVRLLSINLIMKTKQNLLIFSAWAK